VMKPFGELNPRVWQGDCLLGIDQKRSEMFQNCRACEPVLGTDNVHHPDNTARHPLPTPPRFPAGANWVQGGRAIALTNGGGPKLFPTAKRFSSPTSVYSGLATSRVMPRSKLARRGPGGGAIALSIPAAAPAIEPLHATSRRSDSPFSKRHMSSNTPICACSIPHCFGFVR
jgi:hypothetical protein